MNTGGPSGGLGMPGGLGQLGMAGGSNALGVGAFRGGGGGGLGMGMPVANTGFPGMGSGTPGLDGSGASGSSGESGVGMGGMPPGSTGVTLDMYHSFMHRSGEGGQAQ
jgi:hypothetical protein